MGDNRFCAECYRDGGHKLPDKQLLKDLCKVGVKHFSNKYPVASRRVVLGVGGCLFVACQGVVTDNSIAFRAKPVVTHEKKTLHSTTPKLQLLWTHAAALLETKLVYPIIVFGVGRLLGAGNSVWPLWGGALSLPESESEARRPPNTRGGEATGQSAIARTQNTAPDKLANLNCI
jgi:hypothetical protein